MDEYKAVMKFLRVVPRRYHMIVMAIEQTVNLKELTIEDLCGWLATVEEGYELDDATDGVGQLLLTEEEWRAWQKRSSSDGSGGSGSGGEDRRQKKPRPGGNKDGARGNGPSKDDKCRYCGKKGNWAKECRKKKRDEQAQAHLVQEEDDPDPALFMAVRVPDDAVDAIAAALAEGMRVFLNEERAHVEFRRRADDTDTVWFLDSGASNHMIGDEAAFAELDKRISGTVKFGDGSPVVGEINPRYPKRCKFYK